MPVSEPKTNGKGCKIRYVYYGPWYLWNAEKLVRKKILLAATCVLGAALFVLGNCTGADVNRSAFVGVTANLSIAVFLFELLGVIQFCAAKRRVTKPDYQDINSKLRVATWLRAILLFAAGVCCVLLTIVRRLEWDQLLPAFGYITSGLCSVFIYARYSRISIYTEKNKQNSVN